jgi:hypothetical protein
MVSVLAVDPGFEPRSGQTKDYEIGICFFSAKHAALRRKSKDWLAGNQDNVWVTCQTTDCCFSELAPSKHVGLVQRRNFCWVGIKQQSLAQVFFFFNYGKTFFGLHFVFTCTGIRLNTSYQWQVFFFLRVLWFPPPIKLTATI